MSYLRVQGSFGSSSIKRDDFCSSPYTVDTRDAGTTGSCGSADASSTLRKLDRTQVALDYDCSHDLSESLLGMVEVGAVIMVVDRIYCEA